MFLNLLHVSYNQMFSDVWYFAFNLGMVIPVFWQPVFGCWKPVWLMEIQNSQKLLCTLRQ